jgi:hypothetical protein
MKCWLAGRLKNPNPVWAGTAAEKLKYGTAGGRCSHKFSTPMGEHHSHKFSTHKATKAPAPLPEYSVSPRCLPSFLYLILIS